MKKQFLLICSILCLCIVGSDAQYTDLLNFNGTTNPKGFSPQGSLTPSITGDTLFGMTSGLGNNGNPMAAGNIFMIDTNGSNYKDLLNFNGLNSPQGFTPYGSLTRSGNVMYGMTYNGGGAFDGGCIFSVNTDGTGYRDLLNFDSINGDLPFGSLTLSGGVLYGMTAFGVTNYEQFGGGGVFSIHTDGSSFKELVGFNGTNGDQPIGSLTLSGKTLFGMTSHGGIDSGVIFSVDTNGNRYKVLHDFIGGTDGSYPTGSLTLSGSILYGMTWGGGAYHSGCIFSIDTDGNNYKDLFDFNSNTNVGCAPAGDLLLSGNKLYGMTQAGGANGLANLFSINTDGSGYTIMLNFSGTTGPYPGASPTYGGLILLGKMLYGITSQGGTHNDGLIFKVDTSNNPASINTVSSNLSSVSLSPNPNNGQFTIQLPVVSDQLSVQVYNTLGEMVYQTKITQGKSHISLPDAESGVYLYRIINKDGTIRENGKFIVE